MPRMTVPSIQLHDGTSIPQLGFGVFQVDPARHRGGGDAGPRGRLPPHRHRADVRQRGGGGRGDRGRPASRATSSTSPPSSTTASTAPTTRAARSTSRWASSASTAIDLFLIHWPLPTRYDGDFVSTWRTMASFVAGRPRARPSASLTSSRPTSTASSTRPASSRSSTRSRSTPTSPTRTVRAANATHGVATEAWSPIAQGKVARRRRHRRDRRGRSAVPPPR